MSDVTITKREGASVLIADDHPEIRYWLVHCLPHYAVTAAESGAQALAQIRLAPFDLYIIDHDLGDMCGEDVCRFIRGFDPNVPIFIYSGRERPEGAEDRPWTAWIQKTEDPETLCDRIDEALYRQKLINETAMDVELAAIAQDVQDREALLSGRISELGERIRAQWAKHGDIEAMLGALRHYVSSGGTRSSFVSYWRPVAPHLVTQLPEPESC